MKKEITQTKWNPNLGDHVEDMSGTIGKITGLGEFVGMVRVNFGGNVWRDLKIEQLKPAKYSPEQIDKMRAFAPMLFEALQKIADGDNEKQGLINVAQEAVKRVLI